MNFSQKYWNNDNDDDDDDDDEDDEGVLIIGVVVAVPVGRRLSAVVHSQSLQSSEGRPHAPILTWLDGTLPPVVGHTLTLCGPNPSTLSPVRHPLLQGLEGGLPKANHQDQQEQNTQQSSHHLVAHHLPSLGWSTLALDPQGLALVLAERPVLQQLMAFGGV